MELAIPRYNTLKGGITTINKESVDAKLKKKFVKEIQAANRISIKEYEDKLYVLNETFRSNEFPFHTLQHFSIS